MGSLVQPSFSSEHLGGSGTPLLLPNLVEISKLVCSYIYIEDTKNTGFFKVLKTNFFSLNN